MRKFIGLFYILVISISVYAQDEDFSIETIRSTLTNIKKICDKDNGKLWGVNLWGPTMVIDRTTRAIVANKQDSAGILKKNGELYMGIYPSDKIIANSTVELWGTFWTIIANMPQENYLRNSLFIHENFHRVQPEIGIINCGYENNHLDNVMARVLLKLEWVALDSILKNDCCNIELVLKDALTFRYYRRYLYPGVDSMENKFEVIEGLAEYTANKLCTSSELELKEKLSNKHDEYWNKENLVRTFGYYSGFLYSYMLDHANINWRNQVNTLTDLGLLLADSLKITIPNNIEHVYDSIKTLYNYANIYQLEMQFATSRDSLKKKYYEVFKNNPVLIIKLFDPRIGFNVNFMQPVDTLGVVYDHIIINDKWGKLEVAEGGCLISFDWKYAFVPAKDISSKGIVINSSSWEILLNGNWSIKQDNLNYYLEQE